MHAASHASPAAVSAPVLPAVHPNARFMLRHPARLLALGFGSGLSPIMPGTVGTLYSWLTFLVFSQWLDTIQWAILIVISLVLGIWACARTGQDLHSPDHGGMVWDEIVAFWLVLLLLTPADFWTQLCAFLWFRFFDMVKPAPIRHYDRKYKGHGLRGGFGVMFDDIFAAFYTLLVFAIWRVW